MGAAWRDSATAATESGRAAVLGHMSRKWPEKPSGMTVGAECVIPRTLSGAVMLQKCYISVTRMLQIRDEIVTKAWYNREHQAALEAAISFKF